MNPLILLMTLTVFILLLLKKIVRVGYRKVAVVVFTFWSLAVIFLGSFL